MDADNAFIPQFDPKGYAAGRNRRSVYLAWGKYLALWQWAYFVTLTTRWELPAATLLRDFIEGYARRLAAVAECPVPYFVMIEGGTANQQRHVHALVAGVEHLPDWRLRWAWKGGITDAQRYDPTQGAAYYLSKTMGGPVDDYAISKRLPPRRQTP